MNGSITKNNTISIKWNYEQESCDESFAVYWSRNGPISKFSQPQHFVKNTNITSFEIKELGNGKITFQEDIIYLKNSTRNSGCMFIIEKVYPGSRDSLRGERIERREGRASGHIGCKSHFHT